MVSKSAKSGHFQQFDFLSMATLYLAMLFIFHLMHTCDSGCQLKNKTGKEANHNGAREMELILLDSGVGVKTVVLVL